MKSDKGQRVIRAGLQVQSSDHYLQGGNMVASRQAWYKRSWEFFLHLHLKAVRRRLASMQLGGGPQSPPTRWHISSNKATPIQKAPLNGATPWANHNYHIPLPAPSIGLFKHEESMGAIPTHSIIKSTFSPTSKTPIVYSSFNNVRSLKLKVSFEIHPVT